MKRDKTSFDQLFQKYLDNSITKEEYEDLLVFFKEDNQDGYTLTAIEQMISSDATLYIQDHEKMFNRVENNLKVQFNKPSTIKSFYRYYIPYAAALLFAILGVSYYYSEHLGNSTQFITGRKINDVAPGTNRASLILSDGTKYSLREAGGSVVIGNNTIHYKDGGKIAEDLKSQMVSLVTPRGGQYRVVLSDGTKVMLNSSSSLSYPVQFSGVERKVQLKGEGYFEVAKDAERAFIVESLDQRISVLGTKFNISAYGSDPMETTLLEGSIKQKSTVTQQSILLVPGQQIIAHDGELNIREVNANDYTAWTDGVFVFNNMPLEQLFRQLERWYDIEILFAKPAEDIRFYAEIPKTYNLTKVLRALEKVSNLRFSQEGRRVYVSK